ncbi:NHL repeat-containing protein 2-like isoform X1 [Gigantopelta aegis]|uniref:NHL repeat-containing protein 2-like isoform X1 n=1 Tax=Gigantopelta aegis TaxID=1735272 RepID=UPI001B888BD0|nr:NHL repeat-containing protein 2-like isoform X1 [Gigantopelta aegis]
MHVLPHLEELENKHTIQDGLVVIGVHSAKFLSEKSTSNILSALLRYDIKHPVVNDSEALLWQQLQINCWPTFVIVAPNKEFLFTVAGEKSKDLLFEFVEVSLEYFREKKEIQSHSIPLFLEKDKREISPLQFPGKVSVTDRDDLVISNTGNHSILIVTYNGVVKEKIGGVKGYRDGHFQEARFSSPQGTASLGSLIFVADTDNHAIRRIDLVEQRVDTIVGTGCQGYDTEGGKTGTCQEISSPWDLVIGTSPHSEEPDVLYIAMAGSHQIWVYFFKDVTWYKNQQFKAKTCVRFAGSGNEENRNNSYPQKAAFAQPSGLALSPRGNLNMLYIADAESSSVRQISLKDGMVKALVGGERDPRNLFAFGDQDGVGVEARLQHPLGVALVTEGGHLIVADSYNNKIKSVDLKTKVCTTVIGCGLPGNHLSDNHLEVKLNEPGGVCVNQRKQLAYIADTNNHSIKVLSLTAHTLKEVASISRTKWSQHIKKVYASNNISKCY